MTDTHTRGIQGALAGQRNQLMSDLHGYQTFGTSGENYCHWMKGCYWESDVAKARENWME